MSLTIHDTWKEQDRQQGSEEALQTNLEVANIVMTDWSAAWLSKTNKPPRIRHTEIDNPQEDPNEDSQT